MADMFADRLVKKVINDIITDKDTILNNLQVWKSLTRQMFHNYPTIDIYNWFEECLEQASDEDWLEKKWMQDKKFPKREKRKLQRKSVIKLNLKKLALRKKINDNLKITEIAKQYGIKIKGNMAICPFHEDKKPSLSFSDEKNIFHCFGCGIKGDVIEFIRRCENKNIEEKKNDNQKRS